MTPQRRRLAVGATIFALGLTANPYLRGDGVSYYAYVRSAVIDGDLKFENEFRRGDPAYRRNMFLPDGTVRPRHLGDDGYVRNPASVGPALIWTPPFLIGHLVVGKVPAAARRWPRDGFSLPYLSAVAWTTCWLALSGLWLSRPRLLPDRSAIFILSAVLFATPLLLYTFLLPFWSLSLTLLPVAIALRKWMAVQDWSAADWIQIGLLIGFAATIHPTAIAWGALAGVSLLVDRGAVRAKTAGLAAFCAGVVVAAVPQALVKWIIHGSPLDSGYPVRWDWMARATPTVLLSNNHGLFLWSPITIVFIVGVAAMLRSQSKRRLAGGLLAVFAVLTYFVAAYVVPEQSSFGNRFYVVFVPGFVWGAAEVWMIAKEALWTRRIAIVATTALVAWNLLFAFQWSWGMIPKRGPVDFSDFARSQIVDAPPEILDVARRFVTDRSGLTREVEERDERNLSRGEG